MSSALVLGLWSIIVKPGETFPQKITTAIQITNISFGAEVTGDARSVVTLKYPEFEQDDSDDEDDDDEDDEEDVKIVDAEELGGAANGDDEDEDDEDDDEDDSEDGIILPKLITKETVLAVLKPNGTEQVSVNISLVEDVELVEFSVSGPNPVHIIGHYIRQEDFDQDPYSDEDISEFDSEDSDFDDDDEEEDESIDSEAMEGLIAEFKANGGEVIDDDEDEDEEDDSEEEVVQKIQEIKEKSNPKKRAAEDQDSADVASALLADTSASSATLSKNQKKKLAKKLKNSDGVAVPAPVAAASKPVVEKKDDKPEVVKKAAAPQTLAGGLVVLDAKKGDGAVAKSGKKVSMRYIGKLENGKIFDSNTKGAPFNFTLGRGEVIKGWDLGIAGMAVGGERKLTIPAALAYGKKGTQGIPGGATLLFDVKLLSVK